MNWITRLGSIVIYGISLLGKKVIFLQLVLRQLLSALSTPSLIIKQIYEVGFKTLLIIVLSGLAVGMVLGFQIFYTLNSFGATSSLGIAVALTLTRELGPVLSALLFAGRAGSALTAEIGLMKSTQQIDAMEMMAIDPIKKIIVPRFWAGFLSMPLLAAIFTAVGILGAYLIGVVILGLDSAVYWHSMEDGIDFKIDILSGFIKSVVFGFYVIWIALFQGYYAKPTSEGVSQATTMTVVMASIGVLLLDFILTGIMFGD